MNKYTEIEGCLIQKALQGDFDVIAHGCNCQCIMSAGLAPQMAKAFKCNKYDLEDSSFKKDINKLGQIEYRNVYIRENKSVFTDLEGYYTNMYADKDKLKKFTVINAYTQFMYGTNHVDGVSKPLDYEALRLCLRKINYIFKGKHIGLPQIGCHLAGGIWDYTKDATLKHAEYIHGVKKDVKTIIQEELKDCYVTIVFYKP